MSAYLNNQLEF